MSLSLPSVLYSEPNQFPPFKVPHFTERLATITSMRAKAVTKKNKCTEMNSKQHQTPPFSPVAQPEQSCQPKLLHVDFIRDPSSSSRHALNPPLSWFSPHKICCCFSQLQTETSLMTSFQCDSPGSTHPDRGGRQSQNQSQ